MTRFESIAAYYRDRILSGELEPGDKLPSIGQMREQFNVSYGTIRSAVLILKAEKLIAGESGVGVFVCRTGDQV